MDSYLLRYFKMRKDDREGWPNCSSLLCQNARKKPISLRCVFALVKWQKIVLYGCYANDNPFDAICFRIFKTSKLIRDKSIETLHSVQQLIKKNNAGQEREAESNQDSRILWQQAGEPREQRCLKSREYYFFNNTNATHRSLLTFQTQQERGSRPKSLSWFWSKNRKFTFYSSRRLCCSWLLSWDDYLPFGSITVGLFYHNSFARSSSNWTFGVFVIFIRIVVVIFQAKKYSGRAQIIVQQFKFLQAKKSFSYAYFLCDAASSFI